MSDDLDINRWMYMTEGEAADFTRFTKGTLRNLRSQGGGPQFLKVGGSIRYRLSDLIAWMEHIDGK